MNASKEAELKLQRVRIQLLLNEPFFGSLLLYLEPVERASETMKHPTMATDGKHLFYCADFVNNLSSEHLTFVVLHEVGHIALNHLERQQGRNAEQWNWAADFAVNDVLANTTDSSGRKIFMPPPNCLLSSAYHDLCAEEIYKHLPTPPPADGGQGQGQEGQGQGQGQGQGKGFPGDTLDDHSPWKDWNKDKTNEQQNQEWKDRIARAVCEARSRGKVPGGWQTIIDDFLEPKMDWKSIIQDTIVSNVKNDYCLFPPNKKHLWRGIYLPSMRGESISMMFGADVSGSISDEEIHEAFSEVKGIADQFSDYTIYLRTFDTKIQGRWELHPFDPIPQIVTGRGGTDFEEILDDAMKTPGISTLVIFTDLEAPFPPEIRSVPVIWLSVTDKKAPWGLTIKYPTK